MTMIN